MTQITLNIYYFWHTADVNNFVFAVIYIGNR